MEYLRVAGLVLLTVILARIFWVLLHSSVVLWKNRRFGFRPTRPGQQPPTFAGGLVVSWAGMRGIITLAAALALPDGEGAAFPYRDLIVLTAFAVVFGTLVVQGMTLKPLLLALGLEDDDPVGREVNEGRRRALEAAMSAIGEDPSPAAEAVRLELSAHLGHRGESAEPAGGKSTHEDIHRRAVESARLAVIAMRDQDEIGDDAFHRLEEELDRVEVGIGAGG
jgi:CPA1 family monovalent cation:H+ antiporter